ncbi:hypothetical protein GCM10020295_34180 [Streptomyces cinereospinus]
MSRMSPRSRAFAVLAAAAIGSPLLLAAPAQSVEMGTVTYSGKVSCETRFPAPSKAVPTQVALSSGAAADRKATDMVDNDGLRTADYGPVDIVVPLDSTFQLRVAVTCKAPGKKAGVFNRQVEQKALTDEDALKVDLK